MPEEHVLVVPTEVFHQLGYFEGFCDDFATYYDSLMSPENTSYRPRSEMESDPNYKQLIPYVVFRYCDPKGEWRIFQYTRGSGQGEQRLHSKKSVGVGGHISSLEAHFHDPYMAGMQRELEEEVEFKIADYQRTIGQSMIGLINDDSNEVGRVHLGVVHVLDVIEPKIIPREKDLVDAGFWSLPELMESIDRFESWSQFVIRRLHGQLATRAEMPA